MMCVCAILSTERFVFLARRTILGICLAMLAGLALAGQLPAALLGAVGLFIGFGLIHWRAGAPAREFLLLLFGLALAMRFAMAGATYYGSLAAGQRGVIFPDESGYDQRAWDTAQHWRGMGEPVDNRQGIYGNWAAAVYFAMGPDILVLKVTNAVFGAGVAVLIALLAVRLFADERVGKLAGLLTACFPSLIFWTSLNLRDAISLFVIVAALIGGYALLTRPNALHWLLFTAPWLLLNDLRYWVFVPLGWLLPFAALVFPRSAKSRGWTWTIVFLTVLLIPYFWGFGLWGISSINLPVINDRRGAMAMDANTAFVTPITPTPTVRPAATPPPQPIREEGPKTTSTLLHIPTGLVYAIAAPFPWMLENTWLRLAALEMPLWYVLVGMAIYGTAISTSRWREWILVAAYIGVMWLILAVIEGNIGTAARHRDVILAPFVFIFSAQGLIHLWERWRARGIEKNEFGENAKHA